MSGTPPPINRVLLFIKSHVYVILIKVSLLTFFSKKVRQPPLGFGQVDVVGETLDVDGGEFGLDEG